jgi:hypothetical protein
MNTPLPSVGFYVSFISSLNGVKSDGIASVHANTVSFLLASVANTSQSDLSYGAVTSTPPRKCCFQATLGIADITRQAPPVTPPKTTPHTTANPVLTQSLGIGSSTQPSGSGTSSND